MVSFLIVETGLDDNASAGQYSRLWESGLMSVFFDAGYIVTSGPITRLEMGSPPVSSEVEVDFNEAVIGGADYFVVGFIEYNTMRGRAVPVGVFLKVYESNSRQRIHQQNFSAGMGRNFNEELQLARDAGQVIISRIEDR